MVEIDDPFESRGWKQLDVNETQLGPKEDIGGGVIIQRFYWKGVLVGLNEYHFRPDGRPCGGYVTFSNVAETQEWAEHHTGGHLSGHNLVSEQPLEVINSIGCKNCPNHGFITAGKWEFA